MKLNFNCAPPIQENIVIKLILLYLKKSDNKDHQRKEILAFDFDNEDNKNI